MHVVPGRQRACRAVKAVRASEVVIRTFRDACALNDASFLFIFRVVTVVVSCCPKLEDPRPQPDSRCDAVPGTSGPAWLGVIRS